MRSFAFRLNELRKSRTQDLDGKWPSTSRNRVTEQVTGLKIIGAGFGRTGTMSLKSALEELSFSPCYHMTELAKNPAHPRIWDAAGRCEPVDWAEVLGRYRATVDWPWCEFYKELMKAFPDAKVILTVRDPDAWYDSVLNTLYSLKNAMDDTFANHRARAIPNMEPLAPVHESRIWDGTFSGRFEDRRYAIEVFNRHNEQVKQYVPAERLLVYEVKDGWRPLCEFLGVETPDDKLFPHANDTEAFREYNRNILDGVAEDWV